jgi:regulator of sirC expression with transglutaminase-like and TPR domain
MSGPLHFEAPTALEYFEALVADDASLVLTEAAAAIAQDEFPQLDPQSVILEIDRMADKLKRRLPADAAPMQRLLWLNRYFFHELGFGGNVNNYYDPDNSYLHRVLSTRRGIPITLAVLYVELATQLGLSARCVSFPGHFLVKLRLPGGEVVIDPFTGHSLSSSDLDALLAPYKRKRGLEGEFDAPLGLFLQAAPARDVLARLLRNLKEIHGSAQDWPRLLAVQERLVVLLPQSWEEWRDRGMCYAEMGLDAVAAHDFRFYLSHCPNAQDRAAITERLAGFRRPGPLRLH